MMTQKSYSRSHVSTVTDVDIFGGRGPDSPKGRQSKLKRDNAALGEGQRATS